MPKTFVCLITSLALIAPAQALETDQYMMWDKDINDITGYLNSFINKRTWKTIRHINELPIDERDELSCHDVHYEILRSYNENKGLDFISEIERLVYTDPTLSRYPPKETSKLGVINQSIYKKSKLFKLKMFGINIKVNGVYLGVDKTDHIFRTGYSYYKTYRKHRRRGKTEQQAEIAAIKKGITQEKTYYGFWVSGVFSYADLEANYQGLRFHRDFCEGNKPYLHRQDNGYWNFTGPIDLKNYVNPWYDESFYNSAYSPKRFKSVYPELRKYCTEITEKPNPSKQLYAGWEGKESFSVRYLQKLIDQKKLPDPKKYSLENLCH